MKGSAIAWTDNTFNPWWGCTKVSPGCDHCYAERLATRFGYQWGAGAPRRYFGDKHWNLPLIWNGEAAARGVPIKVFCASMADVFDNEVPAEVRARLWRVIGNTPYLEWQLLTKRVGNIPDMLPANWGNGYPQVWLGITVVNQEELERDLPKLVRIPARVRWLSIEPQLGPIELGVGAALVHWVVCGGESGPKARRFELAWARRLFDQCRASGVAFFMKQVGAAAVHEMYGEYGDWLKTKDAAGADPAEWPEDLRVREFPL